jgi:hypothetical protein
MVDELEDSNMSISVIEEEQSISAATTTNTTTTTSYSNPFTAMGPTGETHFAFHILISNSVLLKKQHIP